MKPTKFALKKKVKWHYSPASTCCHPCLEDTASQQEEGLSSEKMYLLMLYLFCGVVAVTLFTVPFHFPVFVVSPSLYISITICTGIQERDTTVPPGLTHPSYAHPCMLLIPTQFFSYFCFIKRGVNHHMNTPGALKQQRWRLWHVLGFLKSNQWWS